MKSESLRESLMDVAYSQPFVPVNELLCLLMNAADTAEKIAFDILTRGTQKEL